MSEDGRLVEEGVHPKQCAEVLKHFSDVTTLLVLGHGALEVVEVVQQRVHLRHLHQPQRREAVLGVLGVAALVLG